MSLHNTGLMVRINSQDISASDPPSRLDIINSLDKSDDRLIKFCEFGFQEYLLNLREQRKDLHENKFNNVIKVDDVGT